MTIQTEPLPNQFPLNSSPENRLGIDPDLVSEPFYRSYFLIGVYLQIIAAHFADFNNISDPVIRNKIEEKPFTEDDKTGILIKTVADWQPTTEETRPAVLLNRGAVEVQRLGIGDSSGNDWRTGQANYATQLAGSHVIFAIARTQSEADRFACEVAKLLLVAIPILRVELQLDQMKLISLGEPAVLQESKDHYAVPIVIAYKVNEYYSVQPHVPVLKRISPVIS